MEHAFEFLIQNTPVAVALIIMTQMFLKYLKSKDAAIATAQSEHAEALKRNTEVIAELKTLIEGMERVLMNMECFNRGREEADGK